MEQRYMDAVTLIRAAVWERPVELRPGLDWRAALRECHGQSCELLALSALLRAEGEAAREAAGLRRYFLARTAEEARRRAALEKLLAGLQEIGCRPTLLKGETLARLYPSPILRESADTDLYFADPAQLQTALAFLTAQGGQADRVRDRREEEGKHRGVLCPGAGRVELHRSLYDREFQQLQLRDETALREPLEELTLAGGLRVQTLGRTDAVKYVFCHMVSHFLFGRCDLRQLCDILLLVHHTRERLNLPELRRFLTETGLLPLFSSVMGVGVEYLGFPPEELCLAEYRPELARGLAEDCFLGGTQGVWNRTGRPRGVGAVGGRILDEKRREKPGPLRRSGRFLARAGRVFFPGRAQLKHLFPECQSRPILLPTAWARNAGQIIQGAAAAKARFRRRAALLQSLGLLEK